MPLVDLPNLTLTRGSHNSLMEGACLLEAVSYLAGEPWSDAPVCVSPVLAAYGRALNDDLADDLRQELKPFILLLPGTASDDQDEARGLLVLDWFIRVYTPAWLRFVPELVADADTLATLPPLTEVGDVAAIEVYLQRVADRADVIEATAWATTGAPSTIASWREAAATTGCAAWAAVKAADGGFVRDHIALDVVMDAVAAAAMIADFTTADDEALWARLAPAVTGLQESAIDLYGRMINPSVAA